MSASDDQGRAVRVDPDRIAAAERVRVYVEAEGLRLGLSPEHARQRAETFAAGLLDPDTPAVLDDGPAPPVPANVDDEGADDDQD